MPSTTLGYVYPSATNPRLMQRDLKALADSADVIASVHGAQISDLIEAAAGTGTVDLTDAAMAAAVGTGGSASGEAVDQRADARIAALAVVKGELTVNVRDFGATGDGTTNDTPAVQAAMDAVANRGGGDVIFPPGTYYMAHSARLSSRTRLVGHGATILKDASSTTGTVFIGVSGSSLGYGGGVTDVTIAGFTLRGSFTTTPSRTVTLVSLHRAARVLIRDCYLYECVTTGHVMDLAGCEDITIRDCTFAGFDPTVSSESTECIQVEQSKRGSVSTMPSNEVYDGTVSRRITVDRCKFLPHKVGSVTYPAPNPIGCHSTREGSPYRDITFTNNTCIDLYLDVTSSASLSKYRGALHFIGTEGLRIDHNTFVSTDGKSPRVISLYQVAIGNPALSDPDVESPVTAIPPVGLTDVSITHNTFTGYAQDTSNHSIVYANPVSGADATIDGVLIADNTFSGGTAEDGREVRIVNVRNVVITGNVFRKTTTVRPCIIGGESDSVIVQGNILDGPGDSILTDATDPSMTKLVVSGNIPAS